MTWPGADVVSLVGRVGRLESSVLRAAHEEQVPTDGITVILAQVIARRLDWPHPTDSEEWRAQTREVLDILLECLTLLERMADAGIEL